MSSHSKATPSTIASPCQFSKMRRRATFGFALVMGIVRLVPMLSPCRARMCDFQDSAWLLELPVFLITLTYLSTPLLHDSEAVRTSRRVILGALKTAISQFGPVASVVAVAETAVPIATVPFLPLLRCLGGGTQRRLLYSAVQNKLSCVFIGVYLLITIVWRSNTTPLWTFSLYLSIPKLLIDRYLDYCRFTTERYGSYGQLQGERPKTPDGDSDGDSEGDDVAIGQDDTIAGRGSVAQESNCDNSQCLKSSTLNGAVEEEEEYTHYSLCGPNGDDEEEEVEDEDERQPETSPFDGQVDDEEKCPEPSSSSVHAGDDNDDDQQDLDPNSPGGEVKPNDTQQPPRSLNGQTKEREEVEDGEQCSLPVNGRAEHAHNDNGEEKQSQPEPSSSSSQVDPEESLAPTEHDDFLTLPIAIGKFPYLSCFWTTVQCAAIYIIPSYAYAAILRWFIDQVSQGDIVMTISVVAGLATIACNLPGFGIGAPLLLARIIRQAQLGNDARLAAQAVLLLADVVSTTVGLQWPTPGKPMSLFDIIWKRRMLRIQNAGRILVFGFLVFTVFIVGLIMASRVLCEPRYLGSGFPSCKPI